MDADCILKAITVLILLRLVACVEGMECFDCKVTSSNEQCRLNGRTEACTAGYHTCFTQIKYEGGSNYVPKSVTRSCVDDTFCSEEQEAYDNGRCVVSDEDYICVWCCHDDNCNQLSSAGRLLGNISPVVLVLAVIVVLRLSGGIAWHWQCGR